MQKMLFRLSAVSLILASMLAGVANADCTSITSAPYVITQSGSYCLVADLTGYINVQANHVNLDFQGHTLTGSVGFSGVSGPVSTDFTLHNGTVITSGGGALFGVSIGGNYRNQPVTNITVDHMHVSGAGAVGIAVVASSVNITNNTVTYTQNTSGIGTATGIDLESIDIASSDIISLPLQGSLAPSHAVVQGNSVSYTTSRTPDGVFIPGTPTAIGIKVSSYADVLISGNTIGNTIVPRQIPSGVAAGIYVDATRGFCGQAACTSAQLGGLIVENNTVLLSPATAVAMVAHHSVGIKISHAPDHAIVIGSKISQMDTGIDANQIAWPGTPPVLLLDNLFTQVTTPTIGGVSLPLQ